MLPLTDRDEDIAQFIELCDGFLFVGGPDIEPWRYGQELLPECGPQNVQRDAMEWKLMEAALAADKPIFGVCRGIQVLNTVLGAGMTSKLFVNVREKLSLCYSVGSAYYGGKGIIAVAAGIDSLHEHDILGCVAGDDTIILIAHSTESALNLCKRLRKIANE